ncbi:GNAT family N-acetyltransferase [Atlantibacter hermannii]|uniref:GNAT family N-acetyltransferase n=1 Tax=Atlantibacter hermannii TaxID=565 RepID=UPI002FFD0C0A
MEIVICGAADVPALATLFVEMEDYYFGHGAVSDEEMRAYLADKVFSSCSGVTVVGARKNGAFVGFATFTLMFPAPLCSGQAFMKELFISEHARGQGVGRSLIRFIVTSPLNTVVRASTGLRINPTPKPRDFICPWVPLCLRKNSISG